MLCTSFWKLNSKTTACQRSPWVLEKQKGRIEFCIALRARRPQTIHASSLAFSLATREARTRKSAFLSAVLLLSCDKLLVADRFPIHRHEPCAWQSDDDFILSHCHMESDGVAQADASKPELPRVLASGVELICVPCEAAAIGCDQTVRHFLSP